MIETVHHQGRMMAMIVRAGFDRPGTSFLTEPGLAQQLAFIRHAPGHTVPAHRHLPVRREITTTQEVIMMRKGRMRVDLYDDREAYLESRVLDAGDVLILVAGGHGFLALEECELFDVKQGPYDESVDKVRFRDVSPDQVRIAERPAPPDVAED